MKFFFVKRTSVVCVHFVHVYVHYICSKAQYLHTEILHLFQAAKVSTHWVQKTNIYDRPCVQNMNFGTVTHNAPMHPAKPLLSGFVSKAMGETYIRFKDIRNTPLFQVVYLINNVSK